MGDERCSVTCDERGSVTMFLAIAAVGLLAMAGLAVDGAAKVRAIQRADRIAAEAGRAAGQAIDLADVMAGNAIHVDRRAAVAAAQEYLRSAHAEGSVQIEPGGDTIRVTTSARVPTVFLGLVGVPAFTVTGSAEVRLVRFERDPRP